VLVITFDRAPRVPGYPLCVGLLLDLDGPLVSKVCPSGGQQRGQDESESYWKPTCVPRCHGRGEVPKASSSGDRLHDTGSELGHRVAAVAAAG